MKIVAFLWVMLLTGVALADEPAQRIYTAPDPAATGAIRGSVNVILAQALAVEHDRTRVYRGTLGEGGKAFSFGGLPVGKYDLVLVTADGSVYEGLALGEEKRDLPAGTVENLKRRVTTQDAFYNRTVIHRVGYDGDNALVFVERIRDKEILRQSAEKLAATLRRLEIMELARAGDDWQVTTARHLYREEQAPGGLDQLKHGFVRELGNLRVIDSVKDLGHIELSPL